MPSLRLRLFVLLLALAALVALVVAGATYASVRAEADELFDYHLRQMAMSLRDQGRIAEDERAAIANPDLDYVVQIWSLDGLFLYSTQPQAPNALLPARTVLGFSNVQVGPATWRVYGAATPLRIVQVSQPLVVRQRLAATAAGRSVLPIVLAAPLVGLAMWWLVGFSLAPLQRVLAAAGARDAASLQPLPVAGLPSEVAPLVLAFNALLERLATAFDAQRAFVADAAHELRTPLTALKLQLGLLRDAPVGPEREKALARLRGGVDRSVHLVTQLLALARAEPGHAVAMQDVDLVALARLIVRESALLATRQGAEVTLEAPPTLLARGNPQALHSLLRNLVDNAILHAGQAPRVQVILQAQARAARIWVDDDGAGIPASERECVFDRFHRREGNGARTEGSGLGLAIVRAIAQQHGGQVALVDSPAGGLRVQVLLPAA